MIYICLIILSFKSLYDVRTHQEQTTSACFLRSHLHLGLLLHLSLLFLMRQCQLLLKGREDEHHLHRQRRIQQKSIRKCYTSHLTKQSKHVFSLISRTKHSFRSQPYTWVLSAASAAREKASLMASSPTLYITVSSTNLLARTNFVTCVPKMNR